MSVTTELTHLLGCELTPVEKSLISIGEIRGSRQKLEDIINALDTYLQLTQEPNEDGTSEDNSEWDRGFQSALALIKGEQK